MNIRTYEVIVDDLENNPHCLHGPTLLFKTNGNKNKEYYACSACRDRRICNFHLPVQEKNKSTTFWKNEQNKIVSSINSQKLYRRYTEFLKLYNCKNDCKSKASYCYTCCCLFSKEESSKHTNCQVLLDITYHQLTHPTEILIPQTENKTHAQYFFSESSVKDIALILMRLEVTKVLCIGVPRIHEYFLNCEDKKVESLLLDIDKNYFNFYSKKQFIWYNMFNNFIFDKKQEEVLYNFFKGGKITVLMDPPFGGRVEPLERSLRMLNNIFLKANGDEDEAQTASNKELHV